MAAPQDDLAYLTALVRQTDRARYYSALFAQPDIRGQLFALYGFAAEIERIPEQVSEPTLGEIRMRWWRDALTGGSEFSATGDSPALRAIGSMIAAHPSSRDALVALVDARNADLYSDAPAGMAEVESYFDVAQGNVFRIAAAICGGDAPLDRAAPHAGVAYGLARRLAATPADRARRRTIFPADLLAVEKLAAADVFVAEPPPQLSGVAAALGQLAMHHLRIAGDLTERLPRSVVPAFLPLATVEPLLAEAVRLGPDLLRRPTSLSDLTLLTRIGRAWLRRRV